MAISRRKFILGGTVVAVAAGAGILTPMLTREGRFVPGTWFC
nr:twin-arginine translocation signal domain-containing protein [Proteus mirabilis]